MNSLRIMIADDHSLVRDGIRAILQAVPEFEVVAEASDGEDAVEKIVDVKPDLVLMDIGMSKMNGLDAAARAKEACPECRVVILSMHANEEYVLQALKAGAAGYLLKDAKKQELIFAIRTVAQGNVYLSPQVSRHVIDNYLSGVEKEISPVEQLTPRQREILKLIAEGKSNKEIAQALSISVKTVDSHRSQLMERLNIHDVVGLVRFAIKTGVVTLGR